MDNIKLSLAVIKTVFFKVRDKNMPIEKAQFISQFSQQALNGRVSLFFGAGGSRDAGYPSWADLFMPLAKDLGIPTDESTDYYRLAQYYSNTFGEAALRQRINERINRNSFESPLLKEITDVGFSNIWTTNFDNAVERNYQKRGILINKVFCDPDFSNIDLNKRVNIFKMNGDVTNLNGIVATQSDYEKYGDSHRVMLMFFKRELISSTFLFVGYSFKDHLVLDCISEISRYLGGTTNYHYTIMKKECKNPYFMHFVDDLERRYHIRVLLVDQYEDVNHVLKELNEKIRSKRVFISGSFSSYAEELEKYSHDFSRQITASLLASDYRIVNGIGRRFGTHLIGYANEYLAKEGIKDIDKYLIVRPFVGRDANSAEKKKLERERVISQCGASIFLFGDQDRNRPYGKSGVLEEFEIARQQHKLIIPISYPGTVSEYIWQCAKNNITQYPYLEGKIEMLTSTCPLDRLSNIIIQILDSSLSAMQ